MANDNAVLLWEKKKELDSQFGEMTAEWGAERSKLQAKLDRAIAAYALKEVPLCHLWMSWQCLQKPPELDSNECVCFVGLTLHFQLPK